MQQPLSHEGGLPLSFSLEPLRTFDEEISVEPVEAVDSSLRRFGGRCLILRNVFSAEQCAHLIQEMSRENMEGTGYRQDYRRNDRCIFHSPELAELLWHRIRGVVQELAVCVHENPAEQHAPKPQAGHQCGCRNEDAMWQSREEKSTDEVKNDSLQDGGVHECPAELRLGYGQEGLWCPKGLNECFRFCRYNAGGFFRAHCDASFQRSEDERSLYTCMLYLDDVKQGGATRFLPIDTLLSNENYLKPAQEVLASVAPEPGLCLVFFQRGLLHEGEDLLGGSKHILRTDVMCCRDLASKPARSAEQLGALRLAMQAEAAEVAGDCALAARLYRQAFKMDPRLERLY